VVVEDFVLPASVVLLRGIVRGSDGRALADVPVQFLSMNAAGFWAGSYDTFVRSGPDGSFQFVSLAGALHRVVAGSGVTSSMDERTQAGTGSARRNQVSLLRRPLKRCRRGRRRAWSCGRRSCVHRRRPTAQNLRCAGPSGVSIA
jgi:hypothetical protein